MHQSIFKCKIVNFKALEYKSRKKTARI